MRFHMFGKITPQGGVTANFTEGIRELFNLVSELPKILTVDTRHNGTTLVARLEWADEAAITVDYESNPGLMTTILERITELGGELISTPELGQALFDSMSIEGPSWYRTITKFALYEPPDGVTDDWREAYRLGHFLLLEGSLVDRCETRYNDGQFLARMIVSMREPTEANTTAQGLAHDDAEKRGFARYPRTSEGLEMWDSLPNVGDTWVRDPITTNEA